VQKYFLTEALNSGLYSAPENIKGKQSNDYMLPSIKFLVSFKIVFSSYVNICISLFSIYYWSLRSQRRRKENEWFLQNSFVVLSNADLCLEGLFPWTAGTMHWNAVLGRERGKPSSPESSFRD
jgi:hypothetical protein